MTKSDLIDNLARVERLTEIRGFGSFKVEDHGGYMGRSPERERAIPVAPEKLPLFGAGMELERKAEDE